MTDIRKEIRESLSISDAMDKAISEDRHRNSDKPTSKKSHPDNTGRFRCPACNCRFFVKDTERTEKDYAEQLKKVSFRLGEFTEIFSKSFFKCKRCSLQIPEELSESATVIFTFNFNKSKPVKAAIVNYFLK